MVRKQLEVLPEFTSTVRQGEADFNTGLSRLEDLDRK